METIIAINIGTFEGKYLLTIVPTYIFIRGNNSKSMIKFPNVMIRLVLISASAVPSYL